MALHKVKLLLLFFVLCSCAKRLKAPMNRFVTPEIVGSGAKVDVNFFTSSNGSLNFSNNRVDNPLEMGLAKGRGIDAAIGIMNYVDLFWSQPHDSVATIGLRYQILGRSNKEKKSLGHKLLVSFSYGDDRDELTSPYEIDLKMTVTEYLITYGYRFKTWAMIYGGLSVANYKFLGTFKNRPGGFNSDVFDYEANWTPTAYAGAVLNYTRIGFKLETGFQRIVWSNTEPFINYSVGYGMYITY